MSSTNVSKKLSWNTQPTDSLPLNFLTLSIRENIVNGELIRCSMSSQGDSTAARLSCTVAISNTIPLKRARTESVAGQACSLLLHLLAPSPVITDAVMDSGPFRSRNAVIYLLRTRFSGPTFDLAFDLLRTKPCNSFNTHTHTHTHTYNYTYARIHVHISPSAS